MSKLDILMSGDVLILAGSNPSSMPDDIYRKIMERKDYAHAFVMGVVAGSASAFSELLATKEEIEAVYKQVVRE